MPEQKILVGSAQTLVSYPLVSPAGAPLLAQATSVTVRIGTPAISLPDTYDNATVDTVSQTLDSNAEEGASYVYLGGAVALVAGRKYLINSSDNSGYTHVVEATISATDSSVSLAEPLVAKVWSGDAFQGFAVSHALTAAETADPGNGIAMWRAVVSGNTYEWAQSFRIVRRIPVCPLDPTSLTQAYPIVHTMRARTDISLLEVISSSWHYRVLRALEAKGVQEENIISTDVLEPLVAIACVYHLAVQDPSQSPDFVQRLAEDYERTMSSVLASRNWCEDPQSEDPGPRPNTEQPSPRRGDIRLSR